MKIRFDKFNNLLFISEGKTCKSTLKTKQMLALSSKYSFSVISDSYRLRNKRKTGQTLDKK